MTDRWPTPPAFGEATPAAFESAETRQLLGLRRSTAADFLGDPGPDGDDLAALLQIAARVPDHRRVTPFRFIVFEGAGRAKAGDVIARAFAATTPDADAARVEKERARFERAPVVVGVVSAVDHDHKTPAWEQILTAGAVCQTLLVAASAAGFAAQWLTEWYAYNRDVLTGLGLTASEEIAGFIYIGTASEPPKERARPAIDEIIRFF